MLEFIRTFHSDLTYLSLAYLDS